MTSNTQILKVQAMESSDPPTYVEATNVSPTAPHLISVQENVQTTQPLSSASQLNANYKLPPINTQNTE